MDIGFDLTHPNFFSADQSRYRIARLWDQLGHTEGTDLGTFIEGREALLSYGHTVDGLLLGHGTHTAGTAAGSGHATPYRGMAFDSELCLVANATSNNMELIPEEEQPLYTSATDALGFKYIFDYAQSVGKPCVVSFSEGAIDSYYGDSELYDEVLASMVGPGRILVASAGNDGERKQFFHKPATEECGTFIRGTPSASSSMPPQHRPTLSRSTTPCSSAPDSMFSSLSAIPRVSMSACEPARC